MENGLHFVADLDMESYAEEKKKEEYNIFKKSDFSLRRFIEFFTLKKKT